MSNNKNKLNFQSKECFSRMNFLYQASMLMAGRNNTLSAYYGALCRNIGKKAVLRIDPSVKRNLCKRCALAQRPGITAELSTTTTKKRKRQCRSSKSDITTTEVMNLDDNVSMQLSCQQCGFKRNFRVNNNYNFWLDDAASIAEINTLNRETESTTNFTNTK